MSATAAAATAEFQITQTLLQDLRVADLKAVAKACGLLVSGRKVDLQDRIRIFVQSGISGSDITRLRTVNELLRRAQHRLEVPSIESVMASIQRGEPTRTALSAPVTTTPIISGVAKPNRSGLNFKPSPFYRLKRSIGAPAFAAKNLHTRGSCSLSFVLSEQEQDMLRSGPQFRVFLLCGEYEPSSTGKVSNIVFPHPLEIHFNGNLLKDNVRGIKNKPGTAKPANLTPHLRYPPLRNELQVVYAFTKQDFLCYCYIVELISPETILQDILKHPKIVKDATKAFIKKLFKDEEEMGIEMDNMVVSLQCPISYSRMKYPVKSIHCSHVQCFDALWMLQSQEQLPTWSCPVCQKHVEVKDLSVCEYMSDILESITDEDVEQVEVDINGHWKAVHEEDDVSDGDMKEEEDRAFIPNHTAAPKDEPIVISLDSDEEEEEVVVERPTVRPVVAQSPNVHAPHDRASLSTFVEQRDVEASFDDFADDDDDEIVSAAVASEARRNGSFNHNPSTAISNATSTVSQPPLPPISLLSQNIPLFGNTAETQFSPLVIPANANDTLPSNIFEAGAKPQCQRTVSAGSAGSDVSGSSSQPMVNHLPPNQPNGVRFYEMYMQHQQNAHPATASETQAAKPVENASSESSPLSSLPPSSAPTPPGRESVANRQPASATNPPPLPPLPAQRKPPAVSPFIPRRPALLPQKRVHSGSSNSSPVLAQAGFSGPGRMSPGPQSLGIATQGNSTASAVPTSQGTQSPPATQHLPPLPPMPPRVAQRASSMQSVSTTQTPAHKTPYVPPALPPLPNLPMRGTFDTAPSSLRNNVNAAGTANNRIPAPTYDVIDLTSDGE